MLWKEEDGTLVECWDNEVEAGPPTVEMREKRRAGVYVPNSLWGTAMELANSELSCDNQQNFILATFKKGDVVTVDLLGHNIVKGTLGDKDLVMPIFRYDTLLKMLMFQPNETFVIKRSQ